MSVGEVEKKHVKSVILEFIAKHMEVEDKEALSREIEDAMIIIGSRVFVNCTPHEIRFTDGRVVKGSVTLAKILSATTKQVVVDRIGDIELVRTVFEPSELGREFVKTMIWECKNEVLLIGSIIAAQTYGYLVVSPICTPETARLPPDKRVVYSKLWNCYW